MDLGVCSEFTSENNMEDPLSVPTTTTNVNHETCKLVGLRGASDNSSTILGPFIQIKEEPEEYHKSDEVDVNYTFEMNSTLNGEELITNNEVVKKEEIDIVDNISNVKKENEFDTFSGREKQFKCNECGQSFFHEAKLLMHVRIHSEENPTVYSDCGTVHKKIKSEMLPNKYEEDISIKSESLDFPSQSTQQGTSIIGLQSEVHRLVKVERWQLSSRVGEGPRRETTKPRVELMLSDFHSCPYCSFVTNTNTNLQKHMLKHNGDKSSSGCKGLGSLSRIKGYSDEHSQGIHLSQQRLSSADAYLGAHQLRKEVQQQSNRDIAESANSSSTGPGIRSLFNRFHNCPSCGHVTKDSAILQRHMSKCTGERPLRRFKVPGGLSVMPGEHQQVKEEQQPATTVGFRSMFRKLHNCPYCSYNGNTSGNLHRHMCTHTGEKPLTCPYCDYKGTDQRRLRIHISQHTQ